MAKTATTTTDPAPPPPPDAYLVTFLGRGNGNNSPELVEGHAMVFPVNSPVRVDDSYARAHGFTDAETLVTLLFDPDDGWMTAVHAKGERPRYTVQDAPPLPPPAKDTTQPAPDTGTEKE